MPLGQNAMRKDVRQRSESAMVDLDTAEDVEDVEDVEEDTMATRTPVFTRHTGMISSDGILRHGRCNASKLVLKTLERAAYNRLVRQQVTSTQKELILVSYQISIDQTAAIVDEDMPAYKGTEEIATSNNDQKPGDLWRTDDVGMNKQGIHRPSLTHFVQKRWTEALNGETTREKKRGKKTPIVDHRQSRGENRARLKP
ncbi:hypothetical protein K504DRAFT_456517 [Pleomassaria siparia CBS 279.74]|uniref:Uncharacterized protein n=1 Tax=Pleomassaria siparia CBS 279.74 TaxID=1314801 RepID=A0A6G1K7L6_9PLEO|nr:hypothetical protein K504DRAFT_456517 [Pleomassaria siparia CBS 279.74]